LRQGKQKAVENDSDAASVDSMMMDVDAVGSDFDDMQPEPAPAKKKAAASKTSKPAKAAPKKAAGKKAAAVVSLGSSTTPNSTWTCSMLTKWLHVLPQSDDEDDFDDDDIEVEEEDEPPKPTKRTNRAAVLRFGSRARLLEYF
jgi:double-strand break repair protein MRE11